MEKFHKQLEIISLVTLLPLNWWGLLIVIQDFKSISLGGEVRSL